MVNLCPVGIYVFHITFFTPQGFRFASAFSILNRIVADCCSGILPGNFIFGTLKYKSGLNGMNFSTFGKCFAPVSPESIIDFTFESDFFF